MIRSFGKTLPLLIAVITGIFFLLHNHMISRFAYEGILLWGKLLVPVLLPYIILSKLWLYYGIIDDIRKIFYKILGSHDTLANTLPIMTIGLICGYPTGAIFVRAGYENHILPKEQAEVLLPLCSFVSPMFLAGYVCSLLDLPTGKWCALLLSLYLSPLLLYGCHMLFDPHFQKRHSVPFQYQNAPKESFTDILDSSLHIIFVIGLYIMIFSILFGFAEEHSMNHLPFLFLLSNLEVTSGISLLSHIDSVSLIFRCIWAAFALSLGGICCYGQIRSIVSGCDLDMGKYLPIKIKQAVISVLILACLWHIT